MVFGGRRVGEHVVGDVAVNAVLDEIEAAANAAAKKKDDPANDKTLSPFFCSPINK